jgi:hypothetical protein
MISCAFALFAHLPARADSFTYDVNYFGLTGNIVASCDSCALSSSDVVSWAFSGQGIDINSSMAGARTLISGSSLQATPSVVSYAFTPDSLDSAVFLVSDSVNFLSYGTAASEGGENVGEIDVCYASSIVYSASSGCFGGLASGTQPIATIAKSTVTAPELDSTAQVTSLTLLFGALAVLLGRRQFRTPA